MRRHCPWLLAAAITAQACAPDHVVQTAPRITVRSGTSETAPGDPQLRPAERTRLSADPAMLEPVMRVSSRLIAAASRLDAGLHASSLSWVIALFEDATPGAFVAPTGEIAVNRGTFRLVGTEGGLAAFLGHELAHALAQALDWQPALSAIFQSREGNMFTYQEELQADEKGLQLTAEAGYDPRELLRLWKSMKLTEEGRDEALKHITYDRRMEHIAEGLPTALIRYEHANRAPQKALPP